METGITAWDTRTMEWSKHVSANTGHVTYTKELIDDPDTGMAVKLLRYPKGTVTPLHTHDCAHGMYVLSGVLHTHKGDFGPGSFVSFPEGNVAEHGASTGGDLEVLFVVNKPFQIHYLGLERESH